MRQISITTASGKIVFAASTSRAMTRAIPARSMLRSVLRMPRSTGASRTGPPCFKNSSAFRVARSRARHRAPRLRACDRDRAGSAIGVDGRHRTARATPSSSGSSITEWKSKSSRLRKWALVFSIGPGNRSAERDRTRSTTGSRTAASALRAHWPGSRVLPQFSAATARKIASILLNWRPDVAVADAVYTSRTFKRAGIPFEH